MKKILLVLMAALLSVGLTACGDEPKAEEKYSDDAYLKAMAKGLEDRWDYADSTTDDVSRKLYETAAQKELDQIKGFTDSKFKDSKLQEKAIQYINVTKESKKIAGEYGSDSFDSDWSKNADTRNQILADIDKEFNIPISKEYQTLLDEQNAKGKEVAEENDKQKTIQEFIDSIQFKEVSNDDGDKEYEAVVENTTPYNFSDFSLDVQLLDSDNVTIASEYADTSHWDSGAKAKLSFSTDEVFSSIKLKESTIETE